MNKILAEKMDKLEEWGVLACPEKLGITVEHVQPIMLVPKKDEGEYRMVTDFSTINTYIKRVPTTSAMMAQAKAKTFNTWELFTPSKVSGFTPVTPRAVRGPVNGATRSSCGCMGT